MSPSPGRDLVVADIRAMPGSAALPRVKGDLVFEAPWQSRAFGTAIAVVQQLDLDWESFRERLITAIRQDADRAYYDSWVVALEQLLLDQGLVSSDDLDSAMSALEA